MRCDEVHVEMQARYMKTHQIAAGVIHDAMAHLGRKTTRFWPPENRGLLTYAPVVSSFMQPHEVWLPVGETGGAIVDAEGRELPTQVLRHPDVELYPAPVRESGQGSHRAHRGGRFRRGVARGHERGCQGANRRLIRRDRGRVCAVSGGYVEINVEPPASCQSL